MERIKDYFNNISKKLNIESDIAGGGSHRGDIGTNREEIFKNFLNNHIPNRLKAQLGGEILGLNGMNSGQLDIIISNDIGGRFDEKEKTFFIAESVASVISVKSFLDKSQLFDALDNLASVPELSTEIISFDSIANHQKNEFFKYHPSMHILAYNGLSAKTISEHLKEYYEINKSWKINRYPSNIIVNGKYNIHYVKQDTEDEFGKKILAGGFWIHEFNESKAGYPFIHLLSDINKYVQWLPHIKLDMKNYYNSSFSQ